MKVEYHLDQGYDQQGGLEDFTRDAFLILPQTATSHLDENGLPPVGTSVRPGIILIAKFGATKSYRREDLPKDLELWSQDKETLRRKYKHMFYDACLYVPEGVHGRVTEAFIEIRGTLKRAVVRLEQQ